MAVLADPADYDALVAELGAHEGHTSLALRRRLAARAFAATAAYDATIAGWFAHADQGEVLPDTLTLALRRVQPDLRYGENPHQHAGIICACGSARGGGGSGAADPGQGAQLQ